MNTLFWKDKNRWKRASVNTFRCLLGCSIGDFGALFALQALGNPFGPTETVAIAMMSGLVTSYSLEVGYLVAKNDIPFEKARETALKMSAVSMLAMEFVETTVDLTLTGGELNIHEPIWWGSLGVSLAAGFLAPLPYNYYMLKKYGKCCH